MEASPVIKAYDHARASEHVQASGEFARAASQTSSVEALRTLKLLEEHHLRLSEILKIPSEPTSQPSDPDAQETEPVRTSSSSSKEAAPTRSPPPSVASRGPPQVPSLAQKRRTPGRDLTSSIASNLASARGIRGKHRGQALSPSVSNDLAPGNLEVHPRSDSSQGKMQNMVDHPGRSGGDSEVRARGESRRRSGEAVIVEESEAPPEDGYNRFYNTFGSLINRISAPLAFAGLPLIAEESTGSQASQPAEVAESPGSRRSRFAGSHSSTAEPELSKIYSKATLRAISKDATDSFYVVPSTGHTASYANILSYHEKERRRQGTSVHNAGAGSIEGDEDDFVDARESPTQLSPVARRRVGRGRSERDLHNAIEELVTENHSLKEALDKLTKRLHMFEASAQNSHLQLAESMRLMRPGSPLSTGSGKMASSDDVSRKRMQELEDQLAKAVRENERKQKTLNKYRDKWEILKAGARARREATTQEAAHQVAMDSLDED